MAIASCWRVPRSYNLARRLALRFGGSPVHAPAFDSRTAPTDMQPSETVMEQITSNEGTVLLVLERESVNELCTEVL